MNRLDDLDGFIDQINETLFLAKLSHFGVGTFDEKAMLEMSRDAIDTGDIAEEYAIAVGDAATAVGSVDREPASLLAGQFRTGLSRELRASSALNDNGANLLRQVGVALAEVVKQGRERRAKAKANVEMDALNKSLLQRMQEATAATPEQRFLAMQRQQMMGGEGTIAERIAQNQNLAEREAIGRGITLDEPW